MINRKRIFPLFITTLTIFMLFFGCKKKKDDNNTVQASIPKVNTSFVDISSQTTATAFSSIADDGGAGITAKGVCWSTSVDPSVNDSITNDGSGKGDFTSALTGLNSKSTYYVRAYATNKAGTGYGNIIAYTTGESTFSDIDGNIYYSVTIGRQVWMMENLKTTHYRDGSPLFNISDSVQWISLSGGAYCYNNNDSLSLTRTYGGLYNWFAVADNRNICPEGWHIPTDDEWNVLIRYLGGDSVAGGKMKITGNSYWDSPNTGATNESGFSAMPGGGRGYLGAFLPIGYCSCFWSATELEGNYARGWNLSMTNKQCIGSSNAKTYGFSVRCIKN